MLRVDGVPVGRILDTERIPALRERGDAAGGDGFHNRGPRHRRPAPAHPVRPAREARDYRAGQDGGGLSDGSGDIFLAFATGNRGTSRRLPAAPATVPLQMVTNEYITPLFHAAAEATEAAILNAPRAGGDMTGDGIGLRSHPGTTPRRARRGAALRSETREVVQVDSRRRKTVAQALGACGDRQRESGGDLPLVHR